MRKSNINARILFGTRMILSERIEEMLQLKVFFFSLLMNLNRNVEQRAKWLTVSTSLVEDVIDGLSIVVPIKVCHDLIFRHCPVGKSFFSNWNIMEFIQRHANEQLINIDFVILRLWNFWRTDVVSSIIWKRLSSTRRRILSYTLGSLNGTLIWGPMTINIWCLNVFLIND